MHEISYKGLKCCDSMWTSKLIVDTVSFHLRRYKYNVTRLIYLISCIMILMFESGTYLRCFYVFNNRLCFICAGTARSVRRQQIYWCLEISAMMVTPQTLESVVKTLWRRTFCWWLLSQWWGYDRPLRPEYWHNLWYLLIRGIWFIKKLPISYGIEYRSDEQRHHAIFPSRSKSSET